MDQGDNRIELRAKNSHRGGVESPPGSASTPSLSIQIGGSSDSAARVDARGGHTTADESNISSIGVSPTSGIPAAGTSSPPRKTIRIKVVETGQAFDAPYYDNTTSWDVLFRVLSLLTGLPPNPRAFWLLAGPHPYQLLAEKKMESQIQSSSQRIYLFTKQSVVPGQRRLPGKLAGEPVHAAVAAKTALLDHSPFEVHSPSALPESASALERSEQLLQHGDAYVMASRRILDSGRRVIAAMEVQLRGLNALLLYIRGCFESFKRTMDQVSSAMRGRLDEQRALSDGFEAALRALADVPLHPSLSSLDAQLRGGELKSRGVTSSGSSASGISLALGSAVTGIHPPSSSNLNIDAPAVPSTLFDCVDVVSWKSRHAIFADAYRDHEGKYRSLLELVEEIEKGVSEFALDVPVNIQDLLYIASVLKACSPQTPSVGVPSMPSASYLRKETADAQAKTAGTSVDTAVLSAGIVEVECPSPPRKSRQVLTQDDVVRYLFRYEEREPRRGTSSAAAAASASSASKEASSMSASLTMGQLPPAILLDDPETAEPFVLVTKRSREDAEPAASQSRYRGGPTTDVLALYIGLERDMQNQLRDFRALQANHRSLQQSPSDHQSDDSMVMEQANIIHSMDTRKRSLVEKLDALNAIKVSLAGEVLRKFQDARNIKANIKEVEASDFLVYIKKWIASTNEHTLVFSSLTRLPELYSQFLNEVGRIRSFNTSMSAQIASARSDVEALMKREDSMRREFWAACGRFLPDYFHRLVPFIKQSPPLPVCKYDDELWRLGDVGLEESQLMTPPITPSQKAESRLALLELELKEKLNLLREQEDEITRLKTELRAKAEPKTPDATSVALSLLSSIGSSDVSGMLADETQTLGLARRLVSYAQDLVSNPNGDLSLPTPMTSAPVEEPLALLDEGNEAIRSKLQLIVRKLVSNHSRDEDDFVQRLNLLELCDKISSLLDQDRSATILSGEDLQASHYVRLLEVMRKNPYTNSWFGDLIGTDPKPGVVANMLECALEQFNEALKQTQVPNPSEQGGERLVTAREKGSQEVPESVPSREALVNDKISFRSFCIGDLAFFFNYRFSEGVMYLALYEPVDVLPGVSRPIYVLGEESPLLKARLSKSKPALYFIGKILSMRQFVCRKSSLPPDQADAPEGVAEGGPPGIELKEEVSNAALLSSEEMHFCKTFKDGQLLIVITAAPVESTQSSNRSKSSVMGSKITGKESPHTPNQSSSISPI